jgi:outer membrane lipase/esterase
MPSHRNPKSTGAAARHRRRSGAVPSRLAAGSAIGALALGCAGAAMAADAPLTSVYVFGDSMSDNGAYAASAPPGAGAFTTNPDLMWDELVTNALKLPTLTPHNVAGTNYAEGGARVAVTSPLQRGGPDITRTPVVTQVDNFFNSGGTLDSHSLVMIVAGGNDVFATLANGPAYSAGDIQDLTSAANALAEQLTRIKDAGAGVVITESIPQFDVYNQLYKRALAAAKPNVLFFDLYKLVAQIEADPSRYGIVNTTDQACNVGKIEAYLCTPALLVTPNANQTYLFTDSVHFTGAGQQMEAEGVLSVLLAPTLIGQLSYVAQGAGQTQAEVLAAQIDDLRAAAPGTWTTFGAISADSVRINSAPQQIGLGSEVAAANLGVAYAQSPTAMLGAALTFSTTDGDFGGDGGGFQAKTVGLGVFGRQRWGRLTGWAEADYAHTDFNDVDRRIDIGHAVLDEVGSTGGERFAVAAGGSADLVAGSIRITPKVALRYDHGRIAGYSEQGDDATRLTFGSQKLETLVASVGLRLSPASADMRFRPYVEVGYNDDLLDRDRQLLVVPNGAPVTWTTPIFKADGSYLTYGAGLTTQVAGRVELTAGVQGFGDRGGLNSTAAFLGLRSAF